MMDGRKDVRRLQRLLAVGCGFGGEPPCAHELGEAEACAGLVLDDEDAFCGWIRHSDLSPAPFHGFGGQAMYFVGFTRSSTAVDGPNPSSRTTSLRSRRPFRAQFRRSTAARRVNAARSRSPSWSSARAFRRSCCCRRCSSARLDAPANRCRGPVPPLRRHDDPGRHGAAHPADGGADPGARGQRVGAVAGTPPGGEGGAARPRSCAVDLHARRPAADRHAVVRAERCTTSRPTRWKRWRAAGW